MIVFGGHYNLENGLAVELEESFERSFSIDRMLLGFGKVGCAPLTRNCLSNPKVREELPTGGDGDENETDVQRQLRLLEEQLQACVLYLSLNGYGKAELLNAHVN